MPPGTRASSCVVGLQLITRRSRTATVEYVVCFLPKKSPWLNPIEPKWIHGKRKVAESDRLLTAHELADRVCKVFGCAHEPHLAIPQEVT